MTAARTQMGSGRPRECDVLIIGAGGMLGRRLATSCRDRHLSVQALSGCSELDITDPAAVESAVRNASPLFVFNASGYTDVDRAEHDRDAAHAVNAEGVRHLAQACATAGAMLVHFSTDYVFDGRKDEAYDPNDAPNPLNVYGESKLEGERAIHESGCRSLVVRTSWLFAPDGRNFALTIHHLAQEREALDVVNDQRGRPTFCEDLAELTLRLIVNQATGVWHVCNSGEATWFDFAAAIVEHEGLSCEVRPCSTARMPRPARRPAYSVLDLTRTTALVGEARHWRHALVECLSQVHASSTREPAHST